MKIEISIKELENIARECRIDALRMVHTSREGHLGGAFSCMDLVTALYFGAMRLDPANPRWAQRDRFILSKGHACFAQYAALARRGFFPVENLETVKDSGTIFGGHPDRGQVPGVEVSTGSLGHGLPIGAGIALAGKRGREDYRVYVLMGDGECQEGSVWEAAMFAASYRLDNLTAIIDANSLQAIERTEKVIPMEPFTAKWEAFGWKAREIDGHNMRQIIETLNALPFETGKPSVIIARTVKGRGVSFMENEIMWHARPTSEAEYEQALEEICAAEGSEL